MQPALHGFTAPRALSKRRAKLHGAQIAASEGASLSFIASVLVTVLTVTWAAVSLTMEGSGFVVLVSDKMQGSEEAASAVARLFAALVLGLFSTQDAGRRLHWVAGGIALLGLGHLVSGYLEPMIFGPPSLNEGLYEGLIIRTLAGILFVIGLVPRTPLRASGRLIATIVALLCAAYVLVFEPLDESRWLPPLASVGNLERATQIGSPFDWLTLWHWSLSVVPLALAAAALLGALQKGRRGLLQDWRLFAMVLFACSSLHEYLWPSAYFSGVLTTAEVLRLAFAVVVAVGGVFELRRVAAEREFLLATERKRIERLRELATLKADFSAMVAHELGGPTAAIRKLTEMLSVEEHDASTRGRTAALIESEIDSIECLIADVRSAASVERDDFKVEPRPVSLPALVESACAYADTLPGNHPVRTTYELPDRFGLSEEVMADPERIGQVLRNLLSNAAKYTPADAPIEIRASKSSHNGHIQIEVADHGPGISPEDLRRIFEKFGRGRDEQGKKVSGAGLGLYLSRRIVQSHGSDLRVQSSPGEGSVFSFDLEAV